MAQSPLETWKEKLEYLLREESLATDAGAKFKLKKDIEECRTKISELETPENSLPLSSYDDGAIKKYIGQCSRTINQGSLQQIAWKWLRPGTRLTLEQLYEQSGSSCHIQEFYLAIEQECTQIRYEHPPLDFWIRRKLATLDYHQAKATALPVELSTRSTEYNFTLLSIVNYLHTEPQKACHQASELAQQALKAAGQVVLNTLCTQPNDCGFWSNFMLPLKTHDLSSSLFQTPAAQQNIQIAQRLWSSCPQPESCLVVTVETLEEPEHLGFWIPIYLNRHTGSAGATISYYEGRGSVVFLDDMPLLGPDLKAQVGQKSWENYIREHLQDQLGFVSIPFFLKSDTGKRRVLAVLNVHFYADDPDIFRRAYGKEWLRIAESQAAPLLCEAYKAVIIQYGRMDNNQIPLIDSNLIHFPLAHPLKP